MAAEIIEVVRDDLDMRNVSPKVVEKVPVLVRRAVIKLQDSGTIPPRRVEYNVNTQKEQKRDGNGNLQYEFFYLPDDFLRLDKFLVQYQDTDDNDSEDPYQRVSTDFLFSKRKSTDQRKFFTITDINIDEERSRKILALDPFPPENSFVEVSYFEDGTESNLANIHKRYWEAIITKVQQIIGLKPRIEAEKEISKESANWRNQEGKDSFNKTHSKTSVKFPWGKT